MLRVNKSTIINAPITVVWKVLRDFNSHSDWHPAIAESQIERLQAVDKVSAVRRFKLHDGSELTEQLLSLSDKDHSLRYCLLETPIPLHGYVSEIMLKPVTDSNATFWNWSSTFTAPQGREQEMKNLVEQQIYQDGFDSIKALFNVEPSDSKGNSSEQDNVRPVTNFSEEPSSERLHNDKAQGADVNEQRYFSFNNTHQADSNDVAITNNANDSNAVQLNTIERSSTIRSDQEVIEASAIIVDQYGGIDELNYRRVNVNPPEHGEVRIRHHAIGVNFIDVYCRTGYFGFLQPPGGLGMEAAGEIIDVGSGVDHLRIGDRVAYASPPVGAYSEVRNINAQSLVKLPETIDYETAAAIMLKGMTAEFLLHRVYKLNAGDTILVHAAAGGVGLMLCQWANAKGATVIGTVSNRDKAALAQQNGCHHPILYTEEDFVTQVQLLTNGRGVDAVFDAIGRQTFGKSIQAVKTCGHVVSFGQAGEPLGEWDLGKFATNSLTLSRPNFGNYTDTPEKIKSICDNLFDALSRGVIKAHIGQRFPLTAVKEAHRDLENRKTVGSTILVPS